MFEYAEPNYILHADTVPADPNYNNLRGLKKIDAPAASDMITGNANIVVGVTDTGVDYDHSDLATNMLEFVTLTDVRSGYGYAI